MKLNYKIGQVLLQSYNGLLSFFFKKRKKEKKKSFLFKRKKNFLNPTYPQFGKKPIHLEKVLPGKRQTPKSFLMGCPISTFNYQLKAAGEFTIPPRRPDFQPSLQSDSHRGCGFHLQKPVPLQPLTGELARWCLLQSSVSASRLVLTYTTRPHHRPCLSTAEQADSSP